MEEGEYKSTYNKLASVRCRFEKALTNHQARCSQAKHFCLADREGYSCEDAESSEKCDELLVKLREKSLFVLKLREIEGPLPHNMEIRVQAGGIIGLSKLLADKMQTEGKVDDISAVIDQVIKQFGSLDKLPYGEIMQSIVQFQGRKRRKR